MELFRNSSQLAQEILGSFDYVIREKMSTEPGPTDLSQVVPFMYYADYVMVARDGDQKQTRAVVVEIQRTNDPRKKWTWPAYWASARAKFECPSVLLVIALDEEIAQWAKGLFERGLTFPFFVLSPGNTPKVSDLEHAQRMPALAVLSAIAHPTLEVAKPATEAIRQLPSDQFRLYFDAILAELPEDLRASLEIQLQGYQYRSEFARRYVAEGVQEGREAGLEEGRKEGVEQGMQNAIIALASAKLGEISPAETSAIRGVSGEAALTQMISQLGQTQSPEEVRAILAQAAATTPGREK